MQRKPESISNACMYLLIHNEYSGARLILAHGLHSGTGTARCRRPELKRPRISPSAAPFFGELFGLRGDSFWLYIYSPTIQLRVLSQLFSPFLAAPLNTQRIERYTRFCTGNNACRFLHRFAYIILYVNEFSFFSIYLYIHRCIFKVLFLIKYESREFDFRLGGQRSIALGSRARRVISATESHSSKRRGCARSLHWPGQSAVLPSEPAARAFTLCLGLCRIGLRSDHPRPYRHWDPRRIEKGKFFPSSLS